MDGHTLIKPEDVCLAARKLGENSKFGFFEARWREAFSTRLKCRRSNA